MLKKWFFAILLGGVMGLPPSLFADNPDKKNPLVRFETNHGDMIIELYPEKAPITCRNFIYYVDSGFYDTTIFHRVIPDFVIQGGGFVTGLQQKIPTASIVNEATNGLKNKRGTLSMARTSQVHSATSQFFINLVDNPFLDHRGRSARLYGYAVFGAVLDGTKVVDKIAKVKTGKIGQFSDVPATDIVIKKASVLRR